MKKLIVLLFLLCAFKTMFSQSSKKTALKEQGNICLKKKSYDEAIKYYSEALVIDSNYTDVLYNLGIAYAKKENWDKSIYYFSKCIERNKSDKEAWYNRGFGYANKGMFKEALKDYKQALIIDPHFYKAKYNYEYISKKISNE